MVVVAERNCCLIPLGIFNPSSNCISVARLVVICCSSTLVCYRNRSRVWDQREFLFCVILWVGVIMALAATSGVFELATLSSLAVVRQGSTSSRSGAHGLRQQGSIPGLKLQEQLRTRKLVACGSRRSFDGVLAVASQDGNIVRFYTTSKIS